MRIELGDDFLKSARNDHPLFRHIDTKSNGSYQWLIKLVNTLKHTKDDYNSYLKFIKVLKSSDKCRAEGIPFTDIAYTFIQQGFKVRIEPDINTRKKPDIEITDEETGEKFYIEVSKLQSSDMQRRITDNYLNIFDCLHFTYPALAFSCTQKRLLADPELKNVLDKIRNAKNEAWSKKEFIVINDEDIELAITHSTKNVILEQWCQDNNRQPDFKGLPQYYDETLRIRNNKLIQEAKQIPETFTGLIYIPLNALHFWMSEPEEVIRQFNSKFTEMPNILGVLLYALIDDPGQQNEYSISGNHFIGKKMVDDITCKYSFFIYNENCNTKLNDEIIDRIYHTFL